MKVGALAALIDGMDARSDIPQVEFIAGDDVIALVFRHLSPLGERDRAALVDFARQHGFAIHLQPGGNDSVHALWPEASALAFRLPQWDVELNFRPLDFIQVNAGLNQKMIASALSLLDAQPQDRVLDLFCGLGNFTLPLARGVREVVGVEGDAGLVARARDNAVHNQLANAQFHAADLAQDLRGEPWMREGFDRVLLDPPRSGADVVLRQLPLKGVGRIVYVSCHPASLARDAGYLVNERGWKLRAAGVMDMFPHTAHVESIAMFEA
jgi:23S rRNA (uracil1939-C5)-methyltransferase